MSGSKVKKNISKKQATSRRNSAHSVKESNAIKKSAASKGTTPQASASAKIRSIIKWKIPSSRSKKKISTQASLSEPEPRERVISDYKTRRKYITKDRRPTPDNWKTVPPIYSRKVIKLINNQAKSCLSDIEDQQEKKRLRKLLETFSNFMEPKLIKDIKMPSTLIHGYLFDKDLNMKVNHHYDSSVRYTQQSHLMVHQETTRNDKKSTELEAHIKKLNKLLGDSLSQSKTSFETMQKTLDQLCKKEEKREILKVLHDEFEEYFKGSFDETNETYTYENTINNDISLEANEDSEEEGVEEESD